MKASEPIGQGKDTAQNALAENAALAKKLAGAILAMRNGATTAPGGN